MLGIIRTAIVATTVLTFTPAMADEIAESIKEAQEAYGDGDLAAAKQALDYASQLIAQKNAERLVEALPAAPEGWSAEDDSSRTQGSSMFGGGIQASRSYRKGDDHVDVTIVGDSPMLAQWLPMMNNPQLAGAMGKMIRIGKQRAIQTSSGEITMVVGSRFLVTVGGSGGDEGKLALARAIDLKALEDF